MIDQDPIQIAVMVASRQETLKHTWQAANAGPGPIRLAVARQLIRLGEHLGDKHADLQELREAAASSTNPALTAR